LICCRSSSFFVAFRLAKAAPQLAHAWAAAVLGSVPVAASAASDIVPVILATACAIVATLIQVSWLLLRRATVTASVWLSRRADRGVRRIDGLAAQRVVYQVEADATVLGICCGARMRSMDLETQPARRAVFQRAAAAAGRLGPPVDRLGRLFLVLGCMNLVVAYQFSTEAWVNFKTFGLLGLTFAYSVFDRHLRGSTLEGAEQWLKP